MEILKYTTGMIFSFDDRNYGDLDGKEYRHYYIIVGTPVINDHKNFYQCMTITSLHNKEVQETDIPIVLNGKISYINTTNISSFHEQRLDENGAYAGIINDERHISKGEMIQMLNEAWMMTHWTGMDDSLYYKVRQKISDYKELFCKINSRVGEYRDTKIFNTMDDQLNKCGIKEQLNIGMVRVVETNINKTEEEKNIDKIVADSSKEFVEVEKIEAKGAKHGKQKECSSQEVKFILKQLYEIENGTSVKKCSMKTLDCFIKTYENYGPSFFRKHSRRFKGMDSSSIKYHYDSAIQRVNFVISTTASKNVKVTSGGGVKN